MLMNIKLNRNSAILLLIIATFFWGGTFALTKELTAELISPIWIVAIKFGLTAVLTKELITKLISPIWIVAIRFGLTALILLIIFFRKILNIFSSQLRSELPKLFLLGLLNFAAIMLQTSALVEIGASNAGFITSLCVLLVPFVDFFFRKKPVLNNIKIAIIIALIGIYIISYGFNLPKEIFLGDILVLLSAIVYSFYIILVGILAKKINAGVLMFFVFFVTGLIALPLAFIISGYNFSSVSIFLINISIKSYINMGFLIVLGTIIPYIFMGIGQKLINAQTASLIYILEPVFAMLIAMLFFSELARETKFIGAAIIIIAQLVGIRNFKKQRKNIERKN